MARRKTKAASRRSLSREAREVLAKAKRNEKLDSTMDRLSTMVDGMIQAVNASERMCWETTALNCFLSNGFIAKEAAARADELIAEWRKRWAPSKAQLHDITALLANKKEPSTSRRKS